jgi:hypothetical protein
MQYKIRKQSIVGLNYGIIWVYKIKRGGSKKPPHGAEYQIK